MDLAKKMITISGLRSVLTDPAKCKGDEVAIVVSGLRPGEKLFEELSYSTNLTGTIHPRIMKASEEVISYHDLQELMLNTRAAISANDYHKLFQVITSIAVGVSNIKRSNDSFTRQC